MLMSTLFSLTLQVTYLIEDNSLSFSRDVSFGMTLLLFSFGSFLDGAFPGVILAFLFLSGRTFVWQSLSLEACSSANADFWTSQFASPSMLLLTFWDDLCPQSPTSVTLSDWAPFREMLLSSWGGGTTLFSTSQFISLLSKLDFQSKLHAALSMETSFLLDSCHSVFVSVAHVLASSVQLLVVSVNTAFFKQLSCSQSAEVREQPVGRSDFIFSSHVEDKDALLLSLQLSSWDFFTWIPSGDRNGAALEIKKWKDNLWEGMTLCYSVQREEQPWSVTSDP